MCGCLRRLLEESTRSPGVGVTGSTWVPGNELAAFARATRAGNHGTEPSLSPCASVLLYNCIRLTQIGVVVMLPCPTSNVFSSS